MQRVLEKMAKQLNGYDEASLMHLWRHYAALVHDFEPTRRWEEAAIALCLIQAIHWKNQLFNYHLAASASPENKDALPPLPDVFDPARLKGKEAKEADGAVKRAGAKATVLRFPARGADQGNENAEG